MKVVKWLVLAFSALAVILAVSAKLQTLGGQGVFTLVMAALPGALVALSLVLALPFARLFAAVSLVAFLIVGMKTSQADEFQNIMMAAAGGILIALVLLIKPEKAGSPLEARRG
jgi:hypothetical protein